MAVHTYIVCYLQSHVRVMYAKRLEQGPVAHVGRFYMLKFVRTAV